MTATAAQDPFVTACASRFAALSLATTLSIILPPVGEMFASAHE